MSHRRNLDLLIVNILLPESEQTWDHIANSINDLASHCRNGAYESPEELICIMKTLSRPLTSALNSERTRLSGPAIDLLASAAFGLGSDFEALLPLFFPSILSLCSRANKVVVARAKACVLTIIQSTQLPPILSHLLQHSKDKSSSLRLVVAEGTLACLNCFNPPDLEKEARAKDIESLIRITATDATADVRRVSRSIFDAYKLLLPGRVVSFTGPLSPTIKKYLDIKVVFSEFDRPTPFQRPQSSLAASTSSVVSTYSSRSAATAPEQPKPSSFNFKNKPKPREILVQSRLPATGKPASVINRACTDEARRVPVPQTRINAAQPMPTRFPPANASGMESATVCIPRTGHASGGPKRMPMPEILTSSAVEHTKISRPRPPMGIAVSSGSRPVAAAPSEHLSIGKHAERPTGESNRATSEQRSQHTQTRAKKFPRTAPVVQSLSQPTQSQLAKVKPMVKGKPTAHSKAPVKCTVQKSTTQTENSKTFKSNDVTQLSLLPSASLSPINMGKNEQYTDLKLDNNTPRREKREGTIDGEVNRTPITELLTSIEQGFLLSPLSPLSPPQSYLEREPIIGVVPFPLRVPRKGGLKRELHDKDGDEDEDPSIVTLTDKLEQALSCGDG